MLSVLASSLANLKFLSLEYLLHSFILSMNFPLLTTPLSYHPVSLSFGIAKIVFFVFTATP